MKINLTLFFLTVYIYITSSVLEGIVGDSGIVCGTTSYTSHLYISESLGNCGGR